MSSRIGAVRHAVMPLSFAAKTFSILQQRVGNTGEEVGAMGLRWFDQSGCSIACMTVELWLPARSSMKKWAGFR